MRWLALFLALLAAPAWAGSGDEMSLLGVSQAGKAASTYTGPGDIVSGATAWYGLRAYKASYATGSNNALNIRRTSDNSTENIVILSSGALDIATANSFAGTDATCTATISGTTLTCASASSTPHRYSTITGSGITQPCYASSVGTFTGGAGTVTVPSSCGTVSVGVTATFQYGLFGTEAYDQSGNGNNVSQSTAADQPQLMPICQNSLPCLRSSGSPITLGPVTITTIAQPYSGSLVSWSLASTGNQIARGGTGSDFGIGWQHNTSAGLSVNGAINLVAQSNAWHSDQYFFSGSSSLINIDGVDSSALSSAGTGATGTNVSLMSGAGNYFNGYVTEAGLWPLGISSTQRGNLCVNQQAYWNTPTC